jgi:hypothetical protein
LEPVSGRRYVEGIATNVGNADANVERFVCARLDSIPKSGIDSVQWALGNSTRQDDCRLG